MSPSYLSLYGPTLVSVCLRFEKIRCWELGCFGSQWDFLSQQLQSALSFGEIYGLIDMPFPLKYTHLLPFLYCCFLLSLSRNLLVCLLLFIDGADFWPPWSYSLESPVFIFPEYKSGPGLFVFLHFILPFKAWYPEKKRVEGKTRRMEIILDFGLFWHQSKRESSGLFIVSVNFDVFVVLKLCHAHILLYEIALCAGVGI